MEEKSIPTIPPVHPALIISNGRTEFPHPAINTRASLRAGKSSYGRGDGIADVVILLCDAGNDEKFSTLVSMEFSGFALFVVAPLVDVTAISGGTVDGGKAVAPRMLGCNKWQNWK